jgi:hypothetical protein
LNGFIKRVYRSGLFEVDAAAGHLLLVLLEDGAVVLGVCKDALELLRCQLALNLDVALLVLPLLLSLLLLILVLRLLRLLTLCLDLFSELLMTVLDADDALPALGVQVVDGHQHLR